ncbi:molecular chaperone DnaK [Rhizomonospora bruguierae]|uniref:molecular chaperone DnaK n=1 Tax=Rhizomonospora bruguierae TaxID=1581705 RepID=UPI001BD0669F|nr:molecular chaperone DnaK [Micromonospora sp. NBRC 107566]
MADTPEKAVGIDLGTTNSVIAALDGGRPTVIANGDGQPTTPSVVAYTDGGDRLVGQLARRQAILNPAGTVHSAKRFIGRRYAEVAEEAAAVAFAAVPDDGGAVRLDIHHRRYTPEEISAQVLRKLTDDAARYLGQPVRSAVVTVPAYFDDAQRTATRDAGRIAGLDVLRIINEPTAAALAYGLHHRGHQTVLVVDLGGGTLDVSVLDVGDGVVRVRATAGDTHLGGDDFDRRLVDRLAGEFARARGVDLRRDPAALQRLSEAAERAKVELSEIERTQVSLPFIAPGNATGTRHLNSTLTREGLEELTADLLERCVAPVRRAMTDAGVTEADLDEVILIGGATRMPAVRALVRRLTGDREPTIVEQPDEVVALGAALQAGILTGEGPDVLLLDVAPLSLGLETLGGVVTRLVERNTTVPVRRAEVFSTAEDNQPAVDIVVVQGERERAVDNRTLGRFRLDGIRPTPRGIPQIEVAFDVDADGILTVAARDRDTGAEQAIEISDTSNLERGEVDRLIAEANRYQDRDAEVREWVGARNALTAMAQHVTERLAELDGRGAPHERVRAEMLAEEARAAVAEDSPIARLRALCIELQQTAQALQYPPSTARPRPPAGHALGADVGAGDGHA